MLWTTIAVAGLLVVIALVLGRGRSGTSFYPAYQGAQRVPEQAMIRPQVTSAAMKGLAAAPAAGIGERAEAAGVVSMQQLEASRPHIARSGSINLLVGDVEKTLRSLRTIVDTQLGDVLSLEDTTPNQPGEAHTARVTLRVPSARFDRTLDALTALGKVQSRSVGAEELTDQIVDSTARLRNLRNEELLVLGIMNRAGKIPDVLEVESKLSDIRGQIERLDAEVRVLKGRVTYSNITVNLSSEISVATVEPSMAAQVGESWKAALRAVRAVFVGIIGTALWVVAFIPYAIALALIAAWIVYRVRARRQPA